jgi:eukaryotic-like serine/threonine-protein kinase
MKLTQEQWQRVEPLLDAALDLPIAERARFVAEACTGDDQLKLQLAALLAADEEASPLLDHGITALPWLSPERVDDARPEARIGAWSIVRELGRGGMGSVYLAERADGQFEQRVALKLVRSDLPAADLVRRFLHERQILARLEHPNIARLLDGGITEEGLPFFVMEYVDGEPITSHCERRRLPVEARLRLFEDVCAAVVHAHRNLIVHRDLKPTNIMVTPAGEVKLLDFGIAKALDESGAGRASDATGTGLYLLTPEYASPEQVRGEPITTATDVYALGLVLYELLTGRRAQHLEQRSAAELARVVGEVVAPAPSDAILHGTATGASAEADKAAARPAAREDARRLARLLRGDLDAIVMKAVRKEPQSRYASVEALLSDLERHRTGLPVAARRGTVSYRARKFVRRHRGAAAAAALVVGSLAGGLVVAAREAQNAAHESARARAVTDFVVGLFHVSHPAQARGRDVTARELLDSGVLRVERELAGQPRLQAELFTVLGSIYRELAALPRADTLLRRAVALNEQLHGTHSERVATSLNQLGGLLIVSGDYAAADSALRRALALRERARRPLDTLVAVSLNNLAVARFNLGDDEDAERLYRRALDIDRRVYGPAHLQVAADLTNLGGLLRRKAAYDAADSALTTAVAIRRRQLPADDPNVADVLSELATLRNAQGRSGEAEQLHREALGIRRTAYGELHPDVALSMSSLASTLSELGRMEEAAPLHEQALAIQERVLGPDHDRTVATLNNLAVLSYRRGDVEGAARTMRRVVSRWRRALGEDHPRVLTGINNLGVMLTEVGEHREAEPLLRRALEGRRALHGERHPEIAQSLRNVGVLLHRAGRRRESEQAFAQALDIGRTVWPPAHPRLAEVLLSYGELLVDINRPATAEDMLREALAIREGLFAAQDERVAEVKRALTRASAARARTQSADTLRVRRR